VVLPDRANAPVAFDLRGQARNVDLRRLPRQLNVPAAATNINGDYHVAGSVRSASGRTPLQGDLRFAPSTVAGATVESGSTVRFDVNGRQIDYETDATIADLDLQRVGDEFHVPALAQ